LFDFRKNAYTFFYGREVVNQRKSTKLMGVYLNKNLFYKKQGPYFGKTILATLPKT
jgi:hypothetical protein